ncbi:thioredoxin domain-containing protein [Gleimia hominis]|uniref:Thioredoxin domain-containing protein n=1 Tax=Gleimia hominis TaxID=595468 RepID=A0ABU3I8G6_9ACTO|nr:thioredoxin domain-containing protein [Gleimia hominis]MDT3766682.1 thioredoxin domain-containing protein [Gleimia hominis]
MGKSQDTRPNKPGTSSKGNRALKILIAAAAVALVLVIAFYATKSWNSDSQEGAAPTGENTAPQDSQSDSGKAQQSEGAIEDEYAQTPPDTNIQQVLQQQAHREEGDPRALGPVDAPVVMVMMEDYSCPMCTKFFHETFPALKKLTDEGKLRLEFRNNVIFRNYGSDIAAYGGQAAANQGHFWQFVQHAYSVAGNGHPEYTRDTVLEIAQASGIKDMQKFEADLDSAQTKQTVELETQKAQQELNILSTPFSAINKTYISGAYPTQYFLNTIKKQAEEASTK